MSTLEELGLANDETPIEIPDDIPEESSGYVPLVQPAANGYTFRLPEDMSTIWARIDSKTKGARLSAGFKRDNPLTIVQDDAFNGFYKNAIVTTFINNIEYPRGAEGIEVADMYYLIKALEARLDDSAKSVLTSNKAFKEALQRQAGKLFKASLHWESYCNPNKNIYMSAIDADGKRKAEEQEGTPGCGSKYTSYSRDASKKIPKYTEGDDEGMFMERFDEKLVHNDEEGCPASLLVNVRLGRFAAVTK